MTMEKSAFTNVIFSVIVILVMILLVPGSGYSEGKPQKFIWSMYTSMPPVFTPPRIYKSIFDAVRKKTGGKLDIKLFTAGQLPYKMEDELSIVSKRRVEVCDVNNQHTSGYRDWMGLTSQAVVFKDINEAKDMWSGPIMDWANTKLKKMDNVIALAPMILANQSIWSKKKIASLEDLKGKRIRVPDAFAEGFIKALGAHPVYMQFAEMNEAVMRGTIDGVLTATHMALENPNWTNIYKGELLCEVNYSLSYFCVNLEAFEELPVELKNILRAEALDKISQMNTGLLNKLDVAKTYVKNPPPGLTVVKISPEERKRLLEIGLELTNNWLAKPGRSAEAKELWALIEKSRN
ncbi:TRAP transporter substrate-binding protein [Thermodesulfobacteriota bacterium]